MMLRLRMLIAICMMEVGLICVGLDGKVVTCWK